MTARPTDRPEVIDLVYEIQREFSRQTEPAGLARVFVEELARLLPIEPELRISLLELNDPGERLQQIRNWLITMSQR